MVVCSQGGVWPGGPVATSATDWHRGDQTADEHVFTARVHCEVKLKFSCRLPNETTRTLKGAPGTLRRFPASGGDARSPSGNAKEPAMLDEGFLLHVLLFVAAE